MHAYTLLYNYIGIVQCIVGVSMSMIETHTCNIKQICIFC